MNSADNRQRIRSAVATTTALSLLSATVALIVNILMARALGPGARGDVAWALQWAYVVSPLLALGVERAALRNERSREELRYIHVWLLGIASGALGLGVAGLTAALTCAIATVGSALAIERGIGVAAGSLRTYSILHIGTQVATLSGSLVLFVADASDPRYWLAAYAIPITGLGAYYLAAHIIRTPRCRAGSSPFGAVDASTLKYMVGGLANIFAARIERLLLPVLSSPRQLGLYVAMATASELVVWGAKGLGDGRVAGLVGRQSSRTQHLKGLLKDFTVFGLLSLPLAAAMLLVLLPLLGDGFADSRTLIAPLCLASVAWSCYLQRSAAWLAQYSSTASVRLDTATALTTAVLSASLIPWLGALGAALGCFLSYATMSIIACIVLPQQQNDRPTA